LSQDRYDDYIKFVNSHKNSGVMQGPEWAKVKEDNWRHETVIALDDDGKITGSMLILIRKLPFTGKTLLYSPRGPVMDFDDEKTLYQLLESAKEVAKKYNAYCLKTDPVILAGQQQYIDMFKKAGFKFTPHLDLSHVTQPRFNFMINLKGKTSGDIMAGFRRKTRYYIKFAEKNGVTVEIKDKSHLHEFYSVYRQTGDRNNFDVRSEKYLAKILDALGDKARLYICYYDGKPVAGAITSQYAGKTCHLYGGSDNEHRHLCPSYLMQWHMINWAIESGCEWYDFMGIVLTPEENEELYRVYEFKNKFNGEVVEYAGEFDYVYDAFAYNLFNMAKGFCKSLSILKKKLKRAKAGGEKTAQNE